MSLINKTIYFLLAMQAFLIAQPKMESWGDCSTCVKHVEIDGIIDSLAPMDDVGVISQSTFTFSSYLLIGVFLFFKLNQKLKSNDSYHISIKHFYPV